MIAGLAFRNVLRNKERSLLTLVGVVLAIGSFVALVSLAAGFTRRVERELASREVHIYVTAGRGSTLPASPLSGGSGSAQVLPLQLQQTLSQVAGVRTVSPIIRTALDTERTVIPVIAMPVRDAQAVFRAARFNLDQMGDSLDDAGPGEGEPVLPAEPTPEVAPAPPVQEPTPTPTPPSASNSKGQSSKGKPGKEKPGKGKPEKPTVTATATANPASEAAVPTPSPEPLVAAPATAPEEMPRVVIGKGLNKEIASSLAEGALIIEEIPFQVGGSMGSDGFLDYTVIAPIGPFLRQRSDRGVHEFWIILEDESKVAATRAEMQRLVDGFLKEEKSQGDYAGARKIRVMDRRDYLESARDYLGYGWLLQFAVSMVGVLIAVTASMNTMLMSTYERLGEYATLRAVGASRLVIAKTIIYEAIFLNVTGGFLGLIFGFLATGVLDKAVAILLEIPYPMAGVTPLLLLQALGLSFAVGLIGAVIPIFIVSRIDLVAQLRKGM